MATGSGRARASANQQPATLSARARNRLGAVRGVEASNLGVTLLTEASERNAAT